MENDDIEFEQYQFMLLTSKYDQVQQEINNIKYYLDRLEKLIEKGKIVESIAEYDENDNLDYQSFLNEMDKEIMKTLRISFLLLIFSKFEGWIDIICNEISEKRRLPLNRKDLSGGLIASFKKFIEVFGNFNKPDSELWNIIEGINDVRNVFVHGDGDINRANQGRKSKIKYLENVNSGLKINKYLDNNENAPHLFFDDSEITYEKISLDKYFLPFVILKFGDFFRQLKDEHLKIFRGLRTVK
jgi:hypothetical protein